MQKRLKKLINYCRKKSPWILVFNTGGCNGCAIEVLTLISPRSDIERFGCMVKGSPRHADILLVDGPITKKAKDRLINLYHQMPEPKVVVAVGACAISQGVFQDCYNIAGPLDKILPVDVYIPGCPPRPEALIEGIVKAIKKLESTRTENTD